MIKITNLTKQYGNTGKVAVNNLTLEVRAGEIFGLLGPNGAGKSTTIKCVTGILKPTVGHIDVAGINVADSPTSAKRNIGFVPDNHQTYEKLKGIEYLNFLADIYKVDKAVRIERIKTLADKLGMTDALGNQISTYSHGMKQKICVIGSMLHTPKVWILDEPLTGLDPQSAFNLKEMMKEHAAAGNTVVFSSHILEVVEKLCTRIAIIARGELVAGGTPEELTASCGNLETFFLTITNQSNAVAEPVFNVLPPNNAVGGGQ